MATRGEPPDLRESGADELERLTLSLSQAVSGTGVMVGTAESCTGGLVAEAITRVPGSSEYFAGSVVAYHNRTKVRMLGVAETLLKAQGAVSPHVAEAMADGARDRLGADVAVSVTGVAGPGGGTPDKPVGLVFVATSGPARTVASRHHFAGDRRTVRLAAAIAALRMRLTTVEEAVGAQDLPPAAGEGRPARAETERPPAARPARLNADAPMVEALFGPAGEVTPVAFRWSGRHHQVSQIGGRRQDEHSRVFTVMTSESRMFELSLDPTMLEWRVRPVGPIPT
jgi:PncC family amidohydrolase